MALAAQRRRSDQEPPVVDAGTAGAPDRRPWVADGPDRSARRRGSRPVRWRELTVRMARLAWALGATVGAVVLAVGVAWTDPGRRRSSVPAGRSVAGGLLVLLGLALRLWATWAFWRHGGGTPLPPLQPRRLVAAGPYRHSRNPLYLGWLAIWVGAGLFAGSPRLLGAAAALSLLLERFEVPWEERGLRRRFGDEYDGYRRRVPRWLRLGSFHA